MLKGIGWTDFPECASYDLALVIDHLLPVARWVRRVPFELARGCLLESILTGGMARSVDGAEQPEEGLIGILIGVPFTLDELCEVRRRVDLLQGESLRDRHCEGRVVHGTLRETEKQVGEIGI